MCRACNNRAEEIDFWLFMIFPWIRFFSTPVCLFVALETSFFNYSLGENGAAAVVARTIDGIFFQVFLALLALFGVA